MTPSTRQSGAVHIMFLIITLVVAIAGWALWFTEQSDNEQLRKAAQLAEENQGVAENEKVALRNAYRAIAVKIGGVPGELPPTPDNMTEDDFGPYREEIRDKFVDVLDSEINKARNAFNGPETMTTLNGVRAIADAMVQGLRSEVAALESEVATLKTAKSSAEKANDDMVTAQNTALASKNDQMRQLRESNASKEQLLESQKDKLSGDLSDISDRYEGALSKHTEEITSLQNTTSSLERDVRSFKTEIRTKRERNQPDGNISGVNLATGSCYIDLGSRHGLRRGTRFNTYGLAKGRVKQYHGYIVVTDIERDRALCRLEDGAKPERGDYITSPIFERDGKLNFYFLGNLPGRFTNEQAKTILGQYGMSVADDFSIFVDFIVLGANPDPEAVGEDANPNWFKETEAYNDAVRWGVEMLRAEDLENYLKY